MILSIMDYMIGDMRWIGDDDDNVHKKKPYSVATNITQIKIITIQILLFIAF